MKNNGKGSGEVVVPNLILDPGRHDPEAVYSPLVNRRVSTLEREAPRILNLANGAGAQVEYLGIAPMFDQPLMVAGETTDWIIGPAGSNEALVVPKEHRQALERLDQAGAHFPVLYTAHETEKGKFPGGSDVPAGAIVPVSADQALDIIGAPPLPAGSVDLADRMNEQAHQVFKAMRTTAIAAGTIAAAPFVLVGSAVGALATLDPIVIGVIPAVSVRDGEPGAWYCLARWDW